MQPSPSGAFKPGLASLKLKKSFINRIQLKELKRAQLRHGLSVSASADESWSMTKTESFRSVTLAIASLAVDVLILAVTGQH